MLIMIVFLVHIANLTKNMEQNSITWSVDKKMTNSNITNVE